jgi:2-polyprenyl-6-methoxyphenol hydroxylase-like FAD-dependent oxidoreductase
VVESVRPVAGRAEVTFHDGQVEEYGFVIGADGVRSTVRRSLFPGQKSRSAVLSTASYEQRRRERVRHVQTATDRFSEALALPAEVRERTIAVAGPKAYRDVFGPLRDS